MPPAPAQLPATLLDAFRATIYRVQLHGGTSVDVHIDQPVDWPDEASESGHRRAPIGRWMIVTPDNPGARERDEAANRTRRAELDAALAEALLPVRGTTRHIDPNGRWPDEHGRLIEVRRFEQGLALARRFGQAAVVCGEPGGPATLIALPREPSPSDGPRPNTPEAAG